MLDGFNEGWIEFEGGEAGSLKGEVSFDQADKWFLVIPIHQADPMKF
jgi:hypothetical protein